MAANPVFPGTLRYGVGSLSTGNANRDGSGSITTVIAGVAAGTVIRTVTIKAETQPADSVLMLWLSDDNGTTWRLFDGVDLGAPAAGSNTVVSYGYSVSYSTLYLPSASHKLGATVSVTPTSGKIHVHAFGADY